MTRRVVASAVVVSVVFSSVVFGAGAASASTVVPVASVQAATENGASSSKARAWMVNVTSSVLKGATPKSWQREQLANQNRFNFSWEKLEAEMGIPVDVPEGQLITDGYFDTPQTKADYDLKMAQQNVKGGPNGKRNTVPSTKMGKFTNAVAGGTAAIVGAEFGFAVGQGVSENLGFDVAGGLCAPTFEDFGLIGLLTGADCAGILNFDGEYIINTDAVGMPAGWGSKSNALRHNWGNDTPPAGSTPATATVDFLEAPTFHDTTPTMKMKGTRSGYCTNNGWNSSLSYTSYFKHLTRTDMSDKFFNGVLESDTAGSLGRSFGYPCAENNPATHTVTTNTATTAPSGYGFDRIVFYASTGNVTWYPEGHVLWTPAVSADPDRVLECDVTGSDGVTYSQQTAAFKESDGGLPAPECPTLPDGVTAFNHTVTEETPGGGAEPKELFSQDTTPEYQAFIAEYPECESGACKLDLKKKGGTLLPSCFDLDSACADWFADANKADNYQCTFGARDVALEECNVYEGVFKPERLAVGAPYSDPETGVWSGGQSATTPGTALMGRAISDPDFARNCFDSIGWGDFNPAEWVLRPIQCAFEWAAIPRPVVVQAAVEEVDANWKSTQLGSFTNAVSSYAFTPPANGCNGIPVDVFFLGPPFYIMGACPGSVLADMAGWARLFGSVAISVLGVVALSRIFAGIVGYKGLGRDS